MTNNPLGIPENPSCTCKRCKQMCEFACWPTPDEARALIEAGYGNQLVSDTRDLEFDDDWHEIYLLHPAGRGSVCATWGQCVFQDSDGMCVLHDLGLKPLEGRVAIHEDDKSYRDDIARLWDNPEARLLVESWEAGSD